jgi:hypothetical protein
VTIPLKDRLLARVTVDHGTGCWLWPTVNARTGYGSVRVGGRTSRMALAHRVSYELHVGPIPEGRQLDHLCRNRACVNPAHLEPVTAQINVLRGEGLAAANAVKTHCVVGHPLTGANLYVCPRGTRKCRACRAEASRRYAQRKRATA